MSSYLKARQTTCGASDLQSFGALDLFSFPRGAVVAWWGRAAFTLVDDWESPFAHHDSFISRFIQEHHQ